MHTFRCSQRKQSSENSCVSMHYALLKNRKLCTMSMPSNEHVHNVNAKLTHNAKCVVYTHSNALKKTQELKSIYVYALCIMHSKKVTSCV